MTIKTDTDKIFTTQIILLRTLAMWPAACKTLAGTLVTKLYYWLLCGSLIFCSYFMVKKVVTYKDIIHQADQITILTITLTGLHRIVYYVNHHADMQWLVQRGIQLAKLAPQNWFKWVPFLFITHSLTGFIFATIWCFCPLLDTWILKRPLGDTEIPMNFHVNVYGWWYATAYAVVGITGIYCTVIFLAADAFFFTVIHVANGAIENLRTKLKRMKEEIPSEEPSSDEKRHNYLKNCVKQHQLIIEYLNKVETVCRTLILAEILHAYLSLSFGAISVKEAETFLTSAKMTLYIGYSYFHQLLNSHFGEMLVRQQELLYNDLHDVPWYECSTSFRKTYCLMLAASKEPIKLSAHTMYYLQYSSFSDFSKSIMSYFMVLNELVAK